MATADEVIAALRNAVAQAKSDLAIEIVANLMEPPDAGGTPVDTGWARANWIPSVGSPTTAPVGSPDAVSSAAATQQAAIAEVAAYRGDQDLWVTNNVDYISRLNDGSSKKAPAGFVDSAIKRAVETLQNSAHATRVRK